VRRPALPVAVLAVGLLGTAALVLWLDRDVSFYFDEWDFLLGRRGSGIDTYLDPHFEHIALIPVAFYKLVVAVFGMDSARPFQVGSTLTLLAAIAVVYAYAQRRVGPWLGLALVAPVAVSGPGWDNVLWPFQIGFTGSIAAGVGALLLLKRARAGADLLACVLLAVSMSCSSLGLAFALAVAVSIAVDPRPWPPRAFVVVAPLALYGLWWIGWGHEAESYLAFSNLAQAPGFVLDGLASSLATLVGVGTVGSAGAIDTLSWGRPLVALALAAATLRLLYLRRVSPGLWVALAFGVGFWLLTALNANYFRAPDSGRYQLIGAVAVVLIAAELLRGVRPTRWVAVAAAAFATVALAGNLAGLDNGRDVLLQASQLQRADRTAVEIARDSVDPDFTIGPELAVAPLYGDAALYLAAVHADGSPAYSTEELLAAPERARVGADKTLGEALEIELAPAARAPAGCDRAELGNGPATVRLQAPQTVEIAGEDAGLTAALRRYAQDSFPVELGEVPAGETRTLELPADRSHVPWQLQLTGAGSARVCDAGG
jgi:hypothetical protein